MKIGHLIGTVGMIATLASAPASAVVMLTGDPGPVGGSAQTMVIDLAGVMTDDMSSFLVDFAPKYIDLVGTGLISVSADVSFDIDSPVNLAFESENLQLLNMAALVGTLDGPLTCVGGAGSDGWDESCSGEFTNTIFNGLEWFPALDVFGTYGSRTVTAGSLTIGFGAGDFTVGSQAIPAPASLALELAALGLLAACRRRSRSRPRQST